MSRPSNTVEHPAEIPLSEALGIDYLSATSTPRVIRSTLAEPRYMERNGLTSTRFQLGDENIFGEVYVRGGRQYVSMRTNPSRLVDPSGWGTASLKDALSEAMDAWVNLLPRYVEPADSFSEAMVSRVDVARDFTGVTAPARFIRNLADAPYDRRGRTKNILRDSKRGETLYWKSGKSLVRLYDKHHQSQGRAPSGTVRFEVQARRNWCRQTGIRAVHDLTVEHIVALVEAAWSRCAFGTPVTGFHQFVQSLMSDDSLTPTRKYRALGLVTAASLGGDWAGLTPKTARTYKRIVARHGLAAVHWEDAWNVAPSTYLDLHLGRECGHVHD